MTTSSRSWSRFCPPAVALGLVLAGCSASPSVGSQALSGQLNTTQFRLVNAEVFARSTTGRVWHAPVSATGAFHIVLPANQTYTVRFGNRTLGTKFFDAFAKLSAVHRIQGRTHLIHLGGAPIVLGTVGRLGTGSAPPASGTAPASDETAHDTEMEHEDDDERVCDLEHESDDVEVESDHAAADSSASDDGHDVEHEVEHEEDAPCSSTAPDGGGTTPGGGSIPPPVNGVI